MSCDLQRKPISLQLPYNPYMIPLILSSEGNLQKKCLSIWKYKIGFMKLRLLAKTYALQMCLTSRNAGQPGMVAYACNPTSHSAGRSTGVTYSKITSRYTSKQAWDHSSAVREQRLLTVVSQYCKRKT